MGPAVQVEPIPIPDGRGGSIVTWRDNLAAAGRLISQRIDNAAQLRWPFYNPSYVGVNSAIANAITPVVIPRKKGGATIAWEDNSNNAYQKGIHIQQVDSMGIVKWFPGGVNIHRGKNPTLTGSSGTDVLISWSEYVIQTGPDNTIYTAKIDSLGNVVWQTYIERSPNSTDLQSVSDGRDGIYLMWKEGSASVGKHFYSNGTQAQGLWFNAQSTSSYLISDSLNGAFIAYGNNDVYVRHIDSAGSITTNLVAVGNFQQEATSFITDGDKGGILFYTDNNIPYAQWIDSSGNAVGSRILLPQEPDNVVADGIGGTIFTWEDSDVILAGHLEMNGGFLSAPGGDTICNHPSTSKFDLSLTNSEPGCAIITWCDTRNGGGNNDIYASKYCGNSINLAPPQPDSIYSPNTICESDTVQLSVAQVQGVISYSWTVPPGWILLQPTDSSTVKVIPTTGGGTVCASAVGLNGSSPSKCQTLFAYPAPNPQINLIGSQAICNGDSVTLFTGSFSSYFWSASGDSTQFISVLDSGQYSVEVTDQFGCKGQSAGQTVSVYESPNAQIDSLGPLTFCSGDSVVLDGGVHNAYTWTPSGDTTRYHTVYTSIPSISVTVTDSNGCIDTSLPVSTLTQQTPIASFAHSTNGLLVSFTDSSTSTNTLWWDFGDGSFSSISNPTHLYSTPGTYVVCLEARNSNCFDVVCDTLIFLPTGIESMSDEGWSVYPIPADQSLMIQTEDTHSGEYLLQVFDALGARVIHRQMDLVGIDKIRIDVSELSEGVYLMHIQGNGAPYYQRIQISH